MYDQITCNGDQADCYSSAIHYVLSKPNYKNRWYALNLIITLHILYIEGTHTIILAQLSSNESYIMINLLFK